MAQIYKAHFELIHAIEVVKYSFRPPDRLLHKGEPRPEPTHLIVKPVYVHGRVPLKRLDPWVMRSEFLDLGGENAESLLEFLNRYGLWSDEHRGPYPDETQVGPHDRERAAGEIAHAPPWSGSVVDVAPIWREQGALREALPVGPAAWFSHNKKFLHFATQMKPPHLLHVDSSILEAIYTSITIDYLVGFHFALCPRPDCAKPFLVDHKAKRFCSQYCAHLVSVRRGRAEAKLQNGRQSPLRAPKSKKR